MKSLYVIADWAADSLTRAEVKIAVEGFLKDSKGSSINFISSTPSTIHTSFLLNQVVADVERYGQPLETVIFQNSDPRLKVYEATRNTEGTTPVIVKLKSGIYLLGPNCEYDFSLVKDKVEEIFVYKGIKVHGQFHSRDLYSRVCAHLMDYLEDELELDEISVDEIPDLTGFYIGHIDNFGNIKTTIRQEDFKGKYEYGDLVGLKINNVTKKAKFVANLFGGAPGELVIYPGSSGHPDNRFLEITIWRHFTETVPTTGREEFNKPRVGSVIELL